MEKEANRVKEAYTHEDFFKSLPPVLLDDVRLELLRGLYHHTEAMRKAKDHKAKLFLCECLGEIHEALDDIEGNS